MKRHFLRLFLVLLINVLAVSPAFAQGLLYTNNNTVVPGNTISGFSVAANGTLTLLPGFPLGTSGGGSPGTPSEGTAIAVVGPWLYATNVGSLSISAFRINPDGSLTPLTGQPFATGSTGEPVTLSVHPSQNFLVCGNVHFGGISVFRINANGTLTPVAGSPFPSSSDPYSSAFSPDGNFSFIGGNSGTTISVYSFNATTGSLTEVAGSPFESGGGNPVGYSISPDGSKLFSVLYSNQIGVYNINSTTGGLTPIIGSPFASGMTGQLIDSVMNGNGTRLFVIGRSAPNDIGVYNIAADGTPTHVAGSPFQSGGTTAEVVAMNETGNLLFVANGDSRNVSVFSINPTTGALTAVSGSPFATGATSGSIGGMSFALPLPPPPPSPVAIPTMNGWGMIMLIVLLGIGSVYYLRRRGLAS